MPTKNHRGVTINTPRFPLRNVVGQREQEVIERIIDRGCESVRNIQAGSNIVVNQQNVPQDFNVARTVTVSLSPHINAVRADAQLHLGTGIEGSLTVGRTVAGQGFTENNTTRIDRAGVTIVGGVDNRHNPGISTQQRTVIRAGDILMSRLTDTVGEMQTLGIGALGAHWDDEAEPRAPVISSDNGIIEASWGDINVVNTDSITLPDGELNKWRKLYMAHDGKSDWTPANIIMAGIRNQENVQNYGFFTPNSRQIDDESYVPAKDELITKAWFDRNKGDSASNNTGGSQISTFEIFICTKNWLEAITTNGLMAFGVGNQNVRLSTISRGRTSAPAISKGVYNRIGIRLYSSGAVSAGTGDNVRVNVGNQTIPFNMIMPNANAWSNEKVIEANVSPENLVSFEIINLATVDIDSYITVEIRLFNV